VILYWFITLCECLVVIISVFMLVVIVSEKEIGRR